ncbi:MAG: hypothetical protein NY202_04830 [Mollicutes bacterium UO1]
MNIPDFPKEVKELRETLGDYFFQVLRMHPYHKREEFYKSMSEVSPETAQKVEL